MVLEEAQKTGNPDVVIYGPAETLTCRICGREYTSRGKRDPGYCRECEKDQQEHKYSGGPLDGEVAE